MNNDDKRNIILVIYDICNNKRRLVMMHTLEKYGVRVQRSAVECFITVKQYDKLIQETSRIIDEETDSLRAYRLGDHTEIKTWGKAIEALDDTVIY